jgi:PTH1 family peptidyl-tRNA hydrolase
LKDGGGHSGHNGLKDIINRVGSDFMRLRFGIGHPPVKKDTNSWVIKRPNPEEKKSLDEAFKKTLSSLDQLLDKDWLIVMNNLHSK